MEIITDTVEMIKNFGIEMQGAIEKLPQYIGWIPSALVVPFSILIATVFVVRVGKWM